MYNMSQLSCWALVLQHSHSSTPTRSNHSWLSSLLANICPLLCQLSFSPNSFCTGSFSNIRSNSKSWPKAMIIKMSTKGTFSQAPEQEVEKKCPAPAYFHRNSGAAVSKEDWGLGITVTFSVACECVGMAWLMQIIIAGESQLLWSSLHPQGPSRWNEIHYRILCASVWQRFVFPRCWSLQFEF